MLRGQYSRFSIGNSSENATCASRAKGSTVVNEKGIIPMNNKITLLGGGNWAAPEGGVYIKRCGFGKIWCIDNDVSNFVESTPVASEIVYINLIIY